MDTIIPTVAIIWLIAGSIFILLEAMAVPGVGFLFSGLAAITLGGLIQFGFIEETNYTLQAGVFLGASGLWAAILWVPLQRFHKKRKGNNFSNMVGDTAIIYKNPLYKNKQGEVKWSGTIMYAMLDTASPVEKLEEGSAVEITSVDGNILIVTPK